jgi:hypothetical protein
MPPFHLADLALTAAQRAHEDPSAQARRLYDRPDALPDPPDAIDDLRDLKAWWRLDRIVAVLGSIRGSALARTEAPAEHEAEAT